MNLEALAALVAAELPEPHYEHGGVHLVESLSGDVQVKFGYWPRILIEYDVIVRGRDAVVGRLHALRVKSRRELIYDNAELRRELDELRELNKKQLNRLVDQELMKIQIEELKRKAGVG